MQKSRGLAPRHRRPFGSLLKAQGPSRTPGISLHLESSRPLRMPRNSQSYTIPSPPRDASISLPPGPESLQHLRAHKIDFSRPPRHPLPVPTAHSLPRDGPVPRGREPHARGGALRNVRRQSRGRGQDPEREIPLYLKFFNRGSAGVLVKPGEKACARRSFSLPLTLAAASHRVCKSFAKTICMALVCP